MLPKKGLALLRDDNGGIIGHLEIATGRLLDAAGKLIRELRPVDEDQSVALTDFAARYAHSRMAQAIGRPVRMRDADGSGVLVQMDLAQTDVHTDGPLPNYAAGYQLAAGIADVAMPVVTVPKASNKFNTWDKENAFKRVLPTGGTQGGQVPEVNPTLSQDSYSTTEYALGAFVSTNVAANADAPLEPFQAAVKRVMNALYLEREIRCATALQTSGNWDTSVVQTIAAGAKWNGGASSDPIADLHAAIEKSYMPVTGIVMSELLEHAFVRNPAVQKYTGYKDSAKPIPTLSDYSAMLRLPPMYSAKMKYISTGTTLSYVWGNHVVLLHQPPQIPPTTQDEVATAYTFRWNGGEAADGTMTAGWQVRQYFDPKRGGRGGTVVVVVHNDDEKITSKFVGGLLLNAYQ